MSPFNPQIIVLDFLRHGRDNFCSGFVKRFDGRKIRGRDGEHD